MKSNIIMSVNTLIGKIITTVFVLFRTNSAALTHLLSPTLPYLFPIFIANSVIEAIHAFKCFIQADNKNLGLLMHLVFSIGIAIAIPTVILFFTLWIPLLVSIAMSSLLLGRICMLIYADYQWKHTGLAQYQQNRAYAAYATVISAAIWAGIVVSGVFTGPIVALVNLLVAIICIVDILRDLGKQVDIRLSTVAQEGQQHAQGYHDPGKLTNLLSQANYSKTQHAHKTQTVNDIKQLPPAQISGQQDNTLGWLFNSNQKCKSFHKKVISYTNLCDKSIMAASENRAQLR